MRKFFGIACCLLLPMTAFAEANNDADYKKGDAYLQQALEAAQRYDMVVAQNAYASAVSFVGEQYSSKHIDYIADMSRVYIRMGSYEQAEALLRPTIDNGMATTRMTADYLIALRYMSKNKEAEKVFTEKFAVLADVPAYGVQNMADMYFRAKEYDKALSLYEELLRRDENQPFVKLGRAYCLADTGKEHKALAEYLDVAAKYPAQHSVLAGDARHFIACGKRGLGRKIFAALGNEIASKEEYQLQYADHLSLHGFYYEADDVYRSLLNNQQLAPAAWAGLGRNKVSKGLYADGERIAQRLEADYPDASEIFDLRTFQETDMVNGDAFVFYEHSKDYKDNDVTFFGIAGEEYFAGNLYGQAQVDFNRYRKHDDSAWIRNFRIGPLYKFDRGQIAVHGVHTWGNYDADSVEMDGRYSFSDYATISALVGKRPHSEAGAILAGIDEKYLVSRYEQRVNEKTLLGVDYELGDMSDGNRFYGIGADVTHNILNKKYHNNNLIFNYSYSTYDFEAQEYESPYLRVAYGAGISQKLISRDETRSLEFINMLMWGHDNDEPTDFNPYSKVEYVKYFNDQSKLTVGAEYGWRTDRLQNRGSLGHSHYNYYVNYYWEW